MNVRKGVTRLLIVWLIAWGAVGYAGWWAYDNAQRGWHDQMPKDVTAFTDPFYRSLAMTFSENSRWGLHVMAFAFWLGLALPICALLLFVVGRWIYRGFKSGAPVGE